MRTTKDIYQKAYKTVAWLELEDEISKIWILKTKELARLVDSIPLRGVNSLRFLLTEHRSKLLGNICILLLQVSVELMKGDLDYHKYHAERLLDAHMLLQGFSLARSVTVTVSADYERRLTQQ